MADGQHILDVLREDAELLLDAEEQLLEVVRAVQQTGQAGRLVLTLTVKTPKNAADRTAVWVSGNVVARAPRPETEDHLFFAVDGQLSRRDPRQPQLPVFAAVADQATGEIVGDAAEGAAQ